MLLIYVIVTYVAPYQKLFPDLYRLHLYDLHIPTNRLDWILS